MNKKFLLGFCVLIAAIALMSVGATMAAWKTSVSETNVLTLGNIKIRLDDEYDEDDGKNITPGNDVKKVVGVTSTGDNDCYVRVLVKKVWDTQSGRTAPSTDWILPDYNTTYWKKADVSPYSGYECWYYKDVLTKASPKTEPLFTSFKLDAANFNVQQYGDFTGHIEVKAEAVQADNFTPTRSGGFIVDWPGVTFSTSD